MTTVNEARATAAEIQTKLDNARTCLAEIDAQRAQLSFGAHSGTNPEAEKALARANRERSAKLLETEELGHAVDEARRRIIEAQNAANVELARANAEKAEPIAERLASRGEQLDKAIADYATHFSAVMEDIDALARLGVPVPSRELIAVNLRRSHDAAVAAVDPKAARPVRPAQRFSFDFLTRGWSRPALTWIASKLNTKAADDRAA